MLAPLALTMALVPTLVSAQTPRATLDATFGTGGREITNIEGNFDMARGVVVQPDGRIVAAGVALGDRGSDFGLARYDSDGTLDASFGTGGRVTTPFPGATVANAFSVALQPDGKVVVAGWTNLDGGADFALARYTSTLRPSRSP
jgi:uncharacterized delta-60 repeat protein